MSRMICIADGKEVEKGYPIREDAVIAFIRKVKQRLGNYKGNKLVVCEEHVGEYRKKRKQYERNVMVLGGVLAIMVFLYLLALLSNFSLRGLLSFLAFTILLTVVFGLLIVLSYVPDVEEEIVEKRRPRRGKRVKKK